MPYPYIYKAQDWQSHNQGPTWGAYLSAYNQNAQRNQQNIQGGDLHASQGVMRSALGPHQTMSNPLKSFESYGPKTMAPMAQNRFAGMQAETNGETFQSDPNRSLYGQGSKDVMQDAKSPQNWALAVASGGTQAPLRAFQSQLSYRKSRDAQANYQAYVNALKTGATREGRLNWAGSLDPRIRVQMEQANAGNGAGMSDEEVNLSRQHLEQQDTENRLTNDVNQYFDDPLREVKNNERLGAQSQAQLGQLGDQYNQLRIKQAQNAAGHGMLGSSVDITHRGQLGRARDSAALGVANNEAAQKADFQHQSNDYKQQLLSLIHSGNPAAAQYAQTQLGSMDQNTQNQLDLYGAQNQMNSINEYGNSLYSQALGGGLNAGANGISAYAPYLYAYANRG